MSIAPGTELKDVLGSAKPAGAARTGYSFGLLDRTAKKEVRRALLKALSIPGHQVPYASREMPIGRGFGTGGLQITLSIAGPDDVLKVIDQGADDSVNACNMRKLIERACPGLSGTVNTADATIVQTRHRIPEQPMGEDQIFVLQVPYPDPLMFIEPVDSQRIRMHGENDYARLYVKLYEDIVRFEEITLSHHYPVHVGVLRITDPSPIPRWDVPRLHQAPYMSLFGAGREKRIYAIPPYTDVLPLEFEDHRFRVEDFKSPGGHRVACERCGATDTFLDELHDDDGNPHHACSDTETCDKNAARRASNGSPQREGGAP